MSRSPSGRSALGRLGHAITAHPSAFTEKPRHSMDWYYPILGGALRGHAAAARIADRWGDFVVDGLGIRCVDDRPWVTGAETCELVLALDAIGDRKAALRQFAAMQHLREKDGSYWTGLVFSDGKRWPVERTTWTGAAVILAADALSSHNRGQRHLPRHRPAGRAAGRLRLRVCGQPVGSLDRDAGIAADPLQHPHRTEHGPLRRTRRFPLRGNRFGRAPDRRRADRGRRRE